MATKGKQAKAVADAPKETVLVLRTCNANMMCCNGSSDHVPFQWPDQGPVEAPDWKPTQECGNGLHGLLWGEGDGSLLNWDENAKWLVVEVEASTLIDLSGKVKFPRGIVMFVGSRDTATDYLKLHGGSGRTIVGGTATAGDSGTATAGYRGTATAGDSGTATAGDSGTATAGYSGTATAGYRGTATAGYSGTATAGYSGTATAGYSGTATAGYRGTATAGDSGTATAGDSGTATAGYRGTATAGYSGILVIRHWDDTAQRYRLVVGYVGEDGIEANTPYRYQDGKFVKVTT